MLTFDPIGTKNTAILILTKLALKCLPVFLVPPNKKLGWDLNYFWRYWSSCMKFSIIYAYFGLYFHIISYCSLQNTEQHEYWIKCKCWCVYILRGQLYLWQYHITSKTNQCTPQAIQPIFTSEVFSLFSITKCGP